MVIQQLTFKLILVMVSSCLSQKPNFSYDFFFEEKKTEAVPGKHP